MKRIQTALFALLATLCFVGCKSGEKSYLNDKLYETPGMGQALPIRATFLDEVS